MRSVAMASYNHRALLENQRRGVSRESWEQHKALIIRLYLQDQLTLDQLRKRMREQFGFDAT